MNGARCRLKPMSCSAMGTRRLSQIALCAMFGFGLCAGTIEAQAKTERILDASPAHGLADQIGLIDVKQSDLLQKRILTDWVSYNGDYSGRRFSSLTQVTPANAGRLVAQWVFHPRSVSPLEVTPVVVARVMFVTSANDVYAL